MDMFGAQKACNTVLHFLVRLAPLELHREQPQELRCLITVIVDCLIRWVSRASGASRGWKAVHSLDPALYFNYGAMREETHCTGINARNADQTRFALCEVAYPFEHGEVFWVSKKDPEVVCEGAIRACAEI